MVEKCGKNTVPICGFGNVGTVITVPICDFGNLGTVITDLFRILEI